MHGSPLNESAPGRREGEGERRGGEGEGKGGGEGISYLAVYQAITV